MPVSIRPQQVIRVAPAKCRECGRESPFCAKVRMRRRDRKRFVLEPFSGMVCASCRVALEGWFVVDPEWNGDMTLGGPEAEDSVEDRYGKIYWNRVPSQSRFRRVFSRED